MTPGGNELGTIGDLVNCDESNSERTGCVRFASLVASEDLSEAMEITSMPVCAVLLPRALRVSNVLTVAKEMTSKRLGATCVVDNKGIIAHINTHRRGALGVVGVLDQLMRKRSISPKVAKFSAKIAKVVDAA